MIYLLSLGVKMSFRTSEFRRHFLINDLTLIGRQPDSGHSRLLKVSPIQAQVTLSILHSKELSLPHIQSLCREVKNDSGYVLQHWRELSVESPTVHCQHQ